MAGRGGFATGLGAGRSRGSSPRRAARCGAATWSGLTPRVVRTSISRWAYRRTSPAVIVGYMTLAQAAEVKAAAAQHRISIAELVRRALRALRPPREAVTTTSYLTAEGAE